MEGFCGLLRGNDLSFSCAKNDFEKAYKDDNLEKHNIAENNFSLKFPSQQDKFTLVWLHLVPSHSSSSVQQVSLWLIWCKWPFHSPI